MNILLNNLDDIFVIQNVIFAHFLRLMFHRRAPDQRTACNITEMLPLHLCEYSEQLITHINGKHIFSFNYSWNKWATEASNSAPLLLFHCQLNSHTNLL